MTTDEIIEVFLSYSHRDEKLRSQLVTHLRVLERQEMISCWHDHRIGPGREWENEIDSHLDAANIILLLVSADFIGSDYCYDIEMRRAMERHDASDARVVPIILRPCDWSGTPFSKLKALPNDGAPVTGSRWSSSDEAFAAITSELRQIAIDLRKRHRSESETGSETLLDDVAVQTATATAQVQLRIDRDFDTFDSDQQARLMSAIAKLLKLSGDIRVISKKEDSVLLTLEIPADRVSRLIQAVNAGDLSQFNVVAAWEPEPVEVSALASLEKMASIAYEELSTVASRLMESQPSANVLEPDALVNEAYIRLAKQAPPPFTDKTHFLALVSKTMRHVLIDNARLRSASRRGQPFGRIELADTLSVTESPTLDLLDLHDALNRLATLHGRRSRVMELRYFGGLTVREIAEVLGVSERTAMNDLRMAKAWLRRELSGE